MWYTLNKMRSEAEAEIFEEAVAALNVLPGVNSAEPAPGRGKGENATSAGAEILIRTASGTYRYWVVVKRNLTRKTLDAILEQLQDPSQGLLAENHLLITDYLTDSLIDRLLMDQVQFVDAAGNMHLHNNHLYILVRGRPPVRKWAVDAFTPAGLKIVFFFLTYARFWELNFRQISEGARVSLGSVSRTVSGLIKQGYLAKEPSGTLRITDYVRLLERWELSYLEAARPRLEPSTWRFDTSSREEALDLLAGRDDVFVGGESAAARLIRSFEPKTLTLHASRPLQRQLQLKLSLVPTQERPEVYLLSPYASHDYHRHWDDRIGVPFAHPILIRTELLAIGGKRLREAATTLLREVILPEAGRS